MSKKRKKNNNREIINKANEEMFNTKEVFVKYAKRYGITLLITVPFILFINYFLSKNIEGYKDGISSFFVSLACLLFACFIALIYYTKKDDKAKENSTKEKERDPFAD